MKQKKIILIYLLSFFVLTGCTILGNAFEPSGNQNKLESVKQKNNDLLKSMEGDWSNWIVFGNPEDHQKIYTMTKDGTNLTKLSDGMIEGIAPLEEYIYFKESQYLYEPGPLKRVNYKGTEEEVIIPYDIDKFITTSDFIFFETNNMIYRSDKDGENTIALVTVSGNIFNFQYENEYLFFSTDRGIYKIDKEGIGLKLIIEGGYYKFKVYEKYLIYSFNEKVKGINLDTEESIDLLNQFNYELFVNDNALFYTEDQYLYRKDLDSMERKKMFLSVFPYEFYGDESFIYCFGDGFIWKIDKELEKKQLIFGQLTQSEMMMLDEDRILLKGYDFERYENNEFYLYEYTEGISKKILEKSVGKIDFQSPYIYFINSEDSYLYNYHSESKEIELVINEPISEFIIINDNIYYSSKDTHYLKYFEQGRRELLLEKSVYNLKTDGHNLYYINREEGNRLYAYKNQSHHKLMDNFITQYAIFDEGIYYKNESENGELYFYQGKQNYQITKETVNHIKQSENTLHYVVYNGTELLYELNPKTRQSELIKFMGKEWLDYVVYNQMIYEVRASENGITVNKTSFDSEIGLYVGSNLKYEFFRLDEYILMYEDYIYKYNKEDKVADLLYPYPIRKYQIDQDWVYISGNVSQMDLKSYIRRIHLETREVELLQESDDEYVPSYEFVVSDNVVYYIMPFEEEKGILYKYNLENQQTATMTQGVYQLLDLKQNVIIYEGPDQSIYKISINDGIKELLVNGPVKYITIVNQDLYYFKFTNTNEGMIYKLDVKTGLNDNLTQEPIKAWNYTLYGDNLYYLENELNELDLKTGEKNTVIENNIEHFYMSNKEVIAYIKDEQEGQKILRIPINK